MNNTFRIVLIGLMLIYFICLTLVWLLWTIMYHVGLNQVYIMFYCFVIHNLLGTDSVLQKSSRGQSSPPFIMMRFNHFYLVLTHHINMCGRTQTCISIHACANMHLEMLLLVSHFSFDPLINIINKIVNHYSSMHIQAIILFCCSTQTSYIESLNISQQSRIKTRF